MVVVAEVVVVDRALSWFDFVFELFPEEKSLSFELSAFILFVAFDILLNDSDAMGGGGGGCSFMV